MWQSGGMIYTTSTVCYNNKIKELKTEVINAFTHNYVLKNRCQHLLFKIEFYIM